MSNEKTPDPILTAHDWLLKRLAYEATLVVNAWYGLDDADDGCDIGPYVLPCEVKLMPAPEGDGAWGADELPAGSWLAFIERDQLDDFCGIGEDQEAALRHLVQVLKEQMAEAEMDGPSQEGGQ